MTEHAIEVADLECRYGSRVVLRDVSFFVDAAELFFIAGGNGSGKSTLLRHLIGLDEPAAGTIAYFGEQLTGADSKQRRAIRRKFGVLFQANALWTSMTVAENVELPLRLHTSVSRADRAEIVGIKLAQVGLSGSGRRSPSELSGGMQKRAALARALVLDPGILFLDEPAAGLDPVHARELDQLILETRDTFGTTMIIVTHDTARILAMGDRVLFLHEGAQGVIAGPPREVAGPHGDERVREFFGTARRRSSEDGSAKHNTPSRHDKRDRNAGKK